MATYEINIKEYLKKEGTAVGLANGTLSADGKIIYRAENLKLGYLNHEKSGNYWYRCSLLSW